MKIVVVGGTGLVGKKVVSLLQQQGHTAIAASPATGVDTVTGKGLAEVLTGADVVMDVSNSPSFEEQAVMNFFTASTRNLIRYGEEAGVVHLVALSVVGTENLAESAYFRAKMAQELLIAKGPLPYSIVHATQFFEFIKPIADLGTRDGRIHLPPAYVQPMSSDDVAAAVARISKLAPANAVVEIAGPEKIRLDDLVRHCLKRIGDSRDVITDSDALYFGAPLSETVLLPGADASLGKERFDDWIRTSNLQR